MNMPSSVPCASQMSTSATLLVLLLILVGAWVIHGQLRHTLAPWHSSGNGAPPYYPHKEPFFGSDLVGQIWADFDNGQYSEGMRSRHVLHGQTFAANHLGNPYIYTIEPQNIDTITSREALNYEKPEWASEAAKHIGNGILLNDGEQWRLSRTMLKPIFSSNAVDEPVLMEPHIRRLIDHMVLLGNREGAFEFQKLADMLMLDVVTEFLFGESAECLGVPPGPGGEDGLDFLALARSFDGPSASFIAVGAPARIRLLCSNRSLSAMVTGMKAFFGRKLTCIMASTEASAAPASPWSVFRTMRAAGIPDGHIQGELQNIFFASWDTTSALLANTVHALLRHRHVQDRLRQEIQALQGKPPTKQDLNNMRYLSLVVKEALRLYSPVTLHSRRAKVDTMLPRGGGQGGQSPIVVPARTTVVWSTYSLNRDPRWYGQDWAEFRPERWASLDESGATLAAAGSAGEGVAGGDGNGRFFMPFGSGRRSCLGRQMAKTEVKYAIVRLLQEFPSLRAKEGAQHAAFREAKAVSFRSADGVWVSVS